jgi:hypothetical protein
LVSLVVVNMVDSRRLAAFRLGLHERFLSLELVAAIQGDAEDASVTQSIDSINQSVLILAASLAESEYSALQQALRRIGEWYAIASEEEDSPDDATVRSAIAKKAMNNLDELRMLCNRAVQKEERLSAWHRVGAAFAELRFRVTHAREGEGITGEDWAPLNRATDALPEADREMAEGFTRRIRGNSLTEFGLSLAEAYGDICQCLSTPDAPAPAGGEAGGDSASIWQDDGRGLQHTRNYSQCRCGGVTYPLVGVTRALVHSLHVLTLEGIATPFEEDLVARAKELYSDDPEVTKQLNNLSDKRLDKVFVDAGIWKTFVLGYKQSGGRKRTYKLDTSRPAAPPDPTPTPGDTGADVPGPRAAEDGT